MMLFVNYIKQLSPEQFLAYQDPFHTLVLFTSIKPFVPETKPAKPVNDGNVITDKDGVSHQTGQAAVQDALPELQVASTNKEVKHFRTASAIKKEMLKHYQIQVLLLTLQWLV